MSRKAYRFVDRLRVVVRAGKGGDGAVSYQPVGPKKKPNGGHGGSGGNVKVVARDSFRTLNLRHISPIAEDGVRGGSNQKTGRRGKDLILNVPTGTVVSVYDENRVNPSYVPEQMDIIGVLDDDGDEVIVAHGGAGGRGNMRQVSESFKFYIPLTKEQTVGLEGETRKIFLSLRSLADVGLVGLPNAGKSTLLGALSAAAPKVGAFPFTTLFPHLGRLEFSDEKSITIADIPGIVEGASADYGMGSEFLKHIERTSVLAFVLDCSSRDDVVQTPSDIHSNRDPNRFRLANEEAELDALFKEIYEYDDTMLSEKRIVILANKMDSADREEDELRETLLRVAAAHTSERPAIVFLSALGGRGLAETATALREQVQAAERAQAAAATAAREEPQVAESARSTRTPRAPRTPSKSPA